jgi:hypothetical protein
MINSFSKSWKFIHKYIFYCGIAVRNTKKADTYKYSFNKLMAKYLYGARFKLIYKKMHIFIRIYWLNNM